MLLTALLYPGDKIIFQKGEVRPIRQPGGYYVDLLLNPTAALLKSLGLKELAAKKTNKLSVRPAPATFPFPFASCLAAVHQLQKLGC